MKHSSAQNPWFVCAPWAARFWIAFVVLGCAGGGDESAREPVVVDEARDDTLVTPEIATRDAATSASADSSGPFAFRDIAAVAGVEFGYYNGARGRMHIRETMGGGVGLIDLDADGWLDLFFTNGCDVPHDPGKQQPRGQLFRSRGGQEFVNATDDARLFDFGYGQGCAVGDLDNDGFDDLVLSRDGSVAVYRNNGDGTLQDVSASCGVASELWNTACALGDLTGDGVLDLFVTGYLDVDPSGEPICRDRRGNPAYCGPEYFSGQSFRLFQNQGDGRFHDLSSEAGVVVPRSKGLAASLLDLDDDGRLDIFVVNDAEPARLFHNQGACRFREIAMSVGLAFNAAGQVYNGMGISQGDYNGDGRIDLVVSNFYEKGVILFKNLGRGLFRDDSGPSRLGPATRPFTSFGLEFLDIDNDGSLDMFIANGHISDLRADGIPYAMKPQVFQNLADGRFRDVSARAGEYFRTEQLGRGIATGDLDNDGACDIAVSHNTGPAAVLRNETANRGHYLTIELVGTRSSRTAVGAKAIVQLRDRTHVRVLAGGGSYLSASDRRITFGLGGETTVAELQVIWPSGQHQQWTDVSCDQAIRVRERS